jgi:hypothetical protein
VRETNSFEKPKSYADGVPYTIVNGVVVIDGGKHTGARPGKPLLGTEHGTRFQGSTVPRFEGSKFEGSRVRFLVRDRFKTLKGVLDATP